VHRFALSLVLAVALQGDLPALASDDDAQGRLLGRLAAALGERDESAYRSLHCSPDNAGDLSWLRGHFTGIYWGMAPDGPAELVLNACFEPSGTKEMCTIIRTKGTLCILQP